MSRPESVFVDVCPSCGEVIPNHREDCDFYSLATVPLAATPEQRMKEFARKQQRAIARVVRDVLARPDAYIDADPDLGALDREVVGRPDKKKPEIRPVDVLASPMGSSFRVITKGTDEPVLVAGKNDKNRSVLIVNTGQPLLGTQAAIAASSAYIDFGPNMQRDAFWLKADAGITLPLTSDIWALDSGGGLQTVLSCVILRAE